MTSVVRPATDPNALFCNCISNSLAESLDSITETSNRLKNLVTNER